jgi:hypothetical protein
VGDLHRSSLRVRETDVPMHARRETQRRRTAPAGSGIEEAEHDMTMSDDEKRAMLCRAAEDGDMCGRCAKPFEPNEPVFRQGYSDDWLHYSRWGGAAPVCAGCVRILEWFVYVAPCVGCGRTVHNLRPKQHTVCSYRCRKNFEALQRKRRRHQSTSGHASSATGTRVRQTPTASAKSWASCPKR